MKNTSKKLLPLVITVASLMMAGAVSTRAKEDSVAQSTDNNPVAATTGKTTDSQPVFTHNDPGSFNRASGLIGMPVHNQQDRRIGWIKDVVFDSNSERIAYVVMTAPVVGQNGYNEKLLAVPMNAFTHNQDQSVLVLNVQEDKIASATGLDRDKANWPTAGDTSWGAEPFWQSDSRDQTESVSDSKDCTCQRLYSPHMKPDGLIDQQQ